MFKRILVVVDDQAASKSAIQYGVEMARVHGAEVLFFYVLPRYVLPMADMPPAALELPREFVKASTDEASRILAAATASAEAKGVLSFRAMASGSDDAECVAQAASKRQCDLIVAATEGRNAVMRLLTGSIIPGLITSAPVPVLVCRSTAAHGEETRRAGTMRPRIRPARSRVRHPRSE